MEKQNQNKNTHKSHRNRMKNTYLSHGFNAFSDVEKLEFILYYAIAQKDTNPIAHKLLDEFGSFDKVLEAPVQKLKEVEGVGEHSAILINLFLQIASAYGTSKNTTKIEGTNSAKRYVANLFKGKNFEEFYVVCLNTANKVIATKLINKGTASQVPVVIKDITDLALTNKCERIILAHNHPIGIARPSDEDLAFTTRILISCIINDIEVLDHIIVTNSEQFSFEETHILPELKEDVMRKIPITSQNRNKFNQASSNYIIGK